MRVSELQSHLDAVKVDGFTILENVFEPERAETFQKRIREIERDTLRPLGPDEKEEDSSFFRTAGLLRLDRMFWDVPIDPTVQPLHPDDALVPVARPHPHAIGCTVMWVITPFNEATGGTRLLPGSHKEPLDLLWSQNSERLSQAIQPSLEPGSVLVFDHALFHGASDNPSDQWRLGLQVSYHAGWIRPYTNWFRSIPIEEVREFPEKLRDLLGYKTYNGIGTVHMAPGAYRESYTMLGKRDPRLPLD